MRRGIRSTEKSIANISFRITITDILKINSIVVTKMNRGENAIL